MARQRKQDILTLCADYSPAEVEPVVKLAVKIWQRAHYNTRYGLSRCKLNAGVKRTTRDLRGNAPNPKDL
eukprot:11204770-Lingulodinium_polyedra.AAC.1